MSDIKMHPCTVTLGLPGCKHESVCCKVGDRLTFGTSCGCWSSCSSSRPRDWRFYQTDLLTSWENMAAWAASALTQRIIQCGVFLIWACHAAACGAMLTSHNEYLIELRWVLSQRQPGCVVILWRTTVMNHIGLMYWFSVASESVI